MPSLGLILLQEIPLYTVLWPLLTVLCFTQGLLVNPPHAALFSATELVFLHPPRNAGPVMTLSYAADEQGVCYPAAQQPAVFQHCLHALCSPSLQGERGLCK